MRDKTFPIYFIKWMDSLDHILCNLSPEIIHTILSYIDFDIVLAWYITGDFEWLGCNSIVNLTLTNSIAFETLIYYAVDHDQLLLEIIFSTGSQRLLEFFSRDELLHFTVMVSKNNPIFDDLFLRIAPYHNLYIIGTILAENLYFAEKFFSKIATQDQLPARLLDDFFIFDTVCRSPKSKEFLGLILRFAPWIWTRMDGNEKSSSLKYFLSLGKTVEVSLILEITKQSLLDVFSSMFEWYDIVHTQTIPEYLDVSIPFIIKEGSIKPTNHHIDKLTNIANNRNVKNRHLYSHIINLILEKN